MANRINLGELQRRNVPLFTREAAALLFEVSSRLGDPSDEGHAGLPPTPDQLWVTDAGDLVIDEVAVAGDEHLGRDQTMAALASLVEALLPPSLRDQPDFAVPGSFRVLAPRARGWPPGLPPIETPADLAAAVARYRRGDTTEVLRHLYARTAPAPIPATAVRADEPVEMVPPPVGPVVAGASAASTKELRSETRRAEDEEAFDLLLNAPGAAKSAWVRPLPPAVAPGRTQFVLMTAAAVVVGLVAGYALTRSLAPRSAPAAAHYESVSPRPPARATGSPVAPRAQTHEMPVTRPTPTSETSVTSSPTQAPAATRSQAARHATAAAASSPSPVPLEIPETTGPVFSPSFAATGSALMFHAGRDPSAQLMAADLRDASAIPEVVTVAGAPARNYHPRLSPDGRYVAFDSDRDGARGVYVVRRDGSDLQRVSGPGFAAVPSWSPDMRTLAFVRAETNRPLVWNLWRLDRATGAQSRVTNHRYGQTWGASWFPDSRRVCYSHEDRLIVLDTENGEAHAFASPVRGRLVRTPAVSPDGRLVAFQVLRNGVWLLDVGTGYMRRLIEDPSAEEFAWAPDGGRLAYHSRRSGEWRIWIAAAPAGIAVAR